MLMNETLSVDSSVEYWVNDEPEVTAAEALERFRNHFLRLRSVGLYPLIERACRRYYGYGHVGRSHSMMPGGDRGELTTLYVNELRNVSTHLLNIVTGQKVSYFASPKYDTLRSREQAAVVSKLLQGVVGSKSLDTVFARAAEYALVTTEGYVRVDWDVKQGEDTGVAEDGRVLKEGDVSVKAYSIMNTACERVQGEEPRWYIFRDFKNKHDLAATYPQFASEIMSGSATSVPSNWDVFSSKVFNGSIFGEAIDDDCIPVFTFLHAKTPATPDGREMMFLTDGTVITHGDLPFYSVPAYRMTPSEVVDSPYSYSPVFDVLGPQDAYNSLLSTVLSNQMAFGVQHIVAQRGSGVQSTKLANGLNLLLYDISKPEPLALVQSPPEIFTSINMYKQIIGSNMGISPISRGEIPEKLSGTAMALADSKSMQYLSYFQRRYSELVKGVGHCIKDVYASRITPGRMLTVMGPKGAYMLRNFNGDEFEGVGGVELEIVNPYSSSVAGRYDMAQQVAQMGLIKNAEDYFEILATGKLTPIESGPVTEEMNIQSENELLMAGQNPPVVATDNDILHIQHHKSVLDHPEARHDMARAKAVTDHIMQHIVSMSTKLPLLSMALGQVPQAMNQQSQAQQRGEPDQPKRPNNEAPGQQAANEPRLPQPPGA